MIYEFIVRDSDYNKLNILQKTADSMGLAENKIVEFVENMIPCPHEDLEVSSKGEAVCSKCGSQLFERG